MKDGLSGGFLQRTCVVGSSVDILSRILICEAYALSDVLIAVLDCSH